MFTSDEHQTPGGIHGLYALPLTAQEHKIANNRKSRAVSEHMLLLVRIPKAPSDTGWRKMHCNVPLHAHLYDTQATGWLHQTPWKHSQVTGT